MAAEEKRAGHRDAESPAGKADGRHDQQGEGRPLGDPVSGSNCPPTCLAQTGEIINLHFKAF